jgi:hypothetical protein
MRRGLWSGIFALGVVTGIAGTALGQQAERLLTHFQTGESYLGANADFRVGYTAGVVDAFSLARYAGDSGRQLRDFDQCMTQWTIGEITTLIDNYIGRGIQPLEQSAALLAHAALNQACAD